MRIKITILFILCAAAAAQAGTSCWTGACNDKWSNAGNWCGAVPDNCRSAAFNGASDTIDLEGDCDILQQTMTITGGNAFTFTCCVGSGGTFKPRSAFKLTCGTASFTGGTNLTTRCNANVNIACCNGDNATMILDGTGGGGDVCLTGNSSFFVGKSGDGTLIMTNGARIDVDNTFSVGSNASGDGTLLMCGSTIDYDGDNLQIGNQGDGYASINNSTICVACGDLQFGFQCGSSGEVISSNSTWVIGEDLIISHNNGGRGDATFSGDCITIGNGLATGRDCGAIITFNCGTKLLVNGCADTGNSPQSTDIGQQGENACVQWHVDGCDTVLTINDPGGINTSSNALVEFTAGGTITGTAQLDFNCGAEVRGCGTLGNPIRLDGGTFSAACGEVLTLGNATSGADAITGGSTDLLDFSGAGTIRIGADDLIDNSNADLDININGGTLNLNGFSQGTEANSIGELTLSNGSAITLDSTDTTQDLYLLDMNIAGSISLNGFQGPGGGAAGTHGRLFVDVLSNGWAVGSGNTGITWAGGWSMPGDTTIIDVNGDGSLYEIVPTGTNVPEPSTYLAGGACLALAFYHYRQRRLSRR